MPIATQSQRVLVLKATALLSSEGSSLQKLLAYMYLDGGKRTYAGTSAGCCRYASQGIDTSLGISRNLRTGLGYCTRERACCTGADVCCAEECALDAGDKTELSYMAQRVYPASLRV